MQKEFAIIKKEINELDINNKKINQYVDKEKLSTNALKIRANQLFSKARNIEGVKYFSLMFKEKCSR
jgi:hypothetical protein